MGSVIKMIKWYVMQSKPYKESFLLSQLALNQIESYLPLMKSKNHSGRVLSKPFFPGYLFVHVDLNERGTACLQWIPGSKGLVKFEDQPPSVPEDFIQKLKRKLERINKSQDSRLFRIVEGHSVSIVHGPFEGYQAIFNEYLPEKDRVKLFLNTLADNAFFVEISASDIAV